MMQQVDPETIDKVGDQLARKPLATFLVLCVIVIVILAYTLLAQNSKHEKQVERLYDRLAISEAEKRTIATDLLVKQIEAQNAIDELKKVVEEALRTRKKYRK